MGRNVSKWCDWQGINLQNIQTVHVAQYKKKKKKKHTIKKWAEDPKSYFSKKYTETSNYFVKYLTILRIKKWKWIGNLISSTEVFLKTSVTLILFVYFQGKR